MLSRTHRMDLLLSRSARRAGVQMKEAQSIVKSVDQSYDVIIAALIEEMKDYSYNSLNFIFLLGFNCSRGLARHSVSHPGYSFYLVADSIANFSDDVIR